jgi:hypothetical protein
MVKRKPQKESAKATLAEVVKEMAKPRMAKSARRELLRYSNQVLIVKNNVEK